MKAVSIMQGYRQYTIYRDSTDIYFKLNDINEVFKGHFERYTKNFFILKAKDIQKITVISGNELLNTADVLYKDVLEGDRRNYNDIIQRLIKLTDHVKYVQKAVTESKNKKQQFTDREICKKCRYAYFENDGKSGKFKWCNYFEFTGNKRPHNGCECYGFEEK